MSEKVYVNDEQALSEMLADKDGHFLWLVTVPDKSGEERTTGIVVNANDIFWWGTADHETVSPEDIKSLYEAWISEKPYATLKWLCMHRKLRPQHPWEEQMKKYGAWDDDLEALPVRDFTG